MELKGFSVVHNGFLSLLSLIMFLGASYGAILKYHSQGFWAGLVCEQDRDPMKGPLFYFSYIFYLSKYYELVDSFLLVLKKVLLCCAWCNLDTETTSLSSCFPSYCDAFCLLGWIGRQVVYGSLVGTGFRLINQIGLPPFGIASCM